MIHSHLHAIIPIAFGEDKGANSPSVLMPQALVMMTPTRMTKMAPQQLDLMRSRNTSPTMTRRMRSIYWSVSVICIRKPTACVFFAACSAAMLGLACVS
jgi:hypothetical protein